MSVFAMVTFDWVSKRLPVPNVTTVTTGRPGNNEKLHTEQSLHSIRSALSVSIYCSNFGVERLPRTQVTTANTVMIWEQ